MSENEKKEEIKQEEEKTSESVKTEEKAENTENPAEEKKEPSTEEKLAESEKQVAELKDQYLRKCADFDNYRKRMLREKQEAFDYANANLLTDLLSVLDDLDRALAASQNAESNESAKSLVDGVKMIQGQLKNMLENKYNLVAFGEKDDAFDPEKHEAIASNPAPVAEAVLAEVYLKGYMLKDRVLRHAKVMVSMPDGSVNENKTKEN
ncbi:MAG: nucleotide exchange factor GrpE [Treponemataceae bacterium]|nr:nucleotide exchange factor GrpE [Treponemataceae bacterium]